MIGWEKIRPGLYKNGNSLIAHRVRPADSVFALIFGAVMFGLGAYQLIGIYTISKYAEEGLALSPGNILPLLLAVIGAIMLYKGKVAQDIRKEQGGIHPNDTLIILDAAQKTVIKQQGLQEEKLTTFDEMRLEMTYGGADNTTTFIVLKHPKGEEILMSTVNKFKGEKMLTEIKKHLHIT